MRGMRLSLAFLLLVLCACRDKGPTRPPWPSAQPTDETAVTHAPLAAPSERARRALCERACQRVAAISETAELGSLAALNPALVPPDPAPVRARVVSAVAACVRACATTVPARMARCFAEARNPADLERCARPSGP